MFEFLFELAGLGCSTAVSATVTKAIMMGLDVSTILSLCSGVFSISAVALQGGKALFKASGKQAVINW